LQNLSTLHCCTDKTQMSYESFCLRAFSFLNYQSAHTAMTVLEALHTVWMCKSAQLALHRCWPGFGVPRRCANISAVRHVAPPPYESRRGLSRAPALIRVSAWRAWSSSMGNTLPRLTKLRAHVHRLGRVFLSDTKCRLPA